MPAIEDNSLTQQMESVSETISSRDKNMSEKIPVQLENNNGSINFVNISDLL